MNAGSIEAVHRPLRKPELDPGLVEVRGQYLDLDRDVINTHEMSFNLLVSRQLRNQQTFGPFQTILKRTKRIPNRLAQFVTFPDHTPDRFKESEVRLPDHPHEFPLTAPLKLMNPGSRNIE